MGARTTSARASTERQAAARGASAAAATSSGIAEGRCSPTTSRVSSGTTRATAAATGTAACAWTREAAPSRSGTSSARAAAHGLHPVGVPRRDRPGTTTRRTVTVRAPLKGAVPESAASSDLVLGHKVDDRHVRAGTRGRVDGAGDGDVEK